MSASTSFRLFYVFLALMLSLEASFAGDEQSDSLTTNDGAVPKLSSPDTDKKDTHDRPVGGVVMRLPRTPGTTVTTPPKPYPTYNPVPPIETTDLPPTPTPEQPPVNPPTFFGEPVPSKSFIFLMDTTGSMQVAGKIEKLRARMIRDLGTLTADVSFNIYAYSGEFIDGIRIPNSLPEGYCPDTTQGCTGALFPEITRKATPENIAAAVAWINSTKTTANGNNSDWDSLRYVLTKRMPPDLNKFFYLSDGGVMNPGQIIADVCGAWWPPFSTKAKFVGIAYFSDVSGMSYMQNLVACTGGIYLTE